MTRLCTYLFPVILLFSPTLSAREDRLLRSDPSFASSDAVCINTCCKNCTNQFCNICYELFKEREGCKCVNEQNTGELRYSKGFESDMESIIILDSLLSSQVSSQQQNIQHETSTPSFTTTSTTATTSLSTSASTALIFNTTTSRIPLCRPSCCPRADCTKTTCPRCYRKMVKYPESCPCVDTGWNHLYWGIIAFYDLLGAYSDRNYGYGLGLIKRSHKRNTSRSRYRDNRFKYRTNK